MIHKTHIETFVPLYITSYCQADCLMCGMRRSNKMLKRYRISDDTVKEQLEIIKSIEHIASVCFLSGEYFDKTLRNKNLDQIIFSIDYAFKIGFEKVLINIGSLDEEEVKLLNSKFSGKNLGLSLFQETYNVDDYKNYLGSETYKNPKADFVFRLETIDRWLNAGFKIIDIGILLGISDPKKDVDNLMEHAKSILDRYDDVELYISLPRVRDYHNVSYFVDDEEFIEYIKKISTTLKNSKIILTTREDSALIKKALSLISVISPGSSGIAPYTKEGYIKNPKESSQFVINEKRPRPSWVLDEFEADGYKIKYYKGR